MLYLKRGAIFNEIGDETEFRY